MPVSFERIPSNIRVPIFYVEVSSRQASYFQMDQVSLLFGPKLAAGIATPLEPTLVSGFDDAVGLFGAGSVLADMVGVFRKNDSQGTLWCIAHDDPTGGTAASIEISILTGATGPGSIYGYIGGERVVANIAANMTPTQIAAALIDAVNAEPFLPVTAAADATDAFTVVLTARNAGLIGNEIDIALNLGGVAAGEVLPPGVTYDSGGFMTGGAGVPPMAQIIAAMGDDEYDFIGSPYSDVNSLDQLDELMNDVTGRWAWDRQVYGHVFACRHGTFQELRDLGAGTPTSNARNGPHVSVLGCAYSASPPWRRAAAATGEAAVAIRADPARPLQTLPLVGVLATPRGRGFTIGQKNTLLYSGIAQEMADTAGQVRIQRMISSYQRNVWGQPDPSWLDVQTPYTLMYVIRFLRQRLLQKFPRHKLADDGTPFGPGQAVATPSIIRGELVAAYSELEEMGLVENMDMFKANLIVERNANDPNRVDILFPPDLINQLRILAMLVEFRLQYPAPVLGAAA